MIFLNCQKAREGRFWLDGEETRLLSGSIHYFRVPHQYWRDRLLKLKATGMNMVETYVAWVSTRILPVTPSLTY